MKITELIGKTLTKVYRKDLGDWDGEAIMFCEQNGDIYQMSHYQECCEEVTIEDICGDLDDLIDTPILKASEDTNYENPEGKELDLGEFGDAISLWTFYNISTIKGSITIRWCGHSNGYYGVGVEFNKVDSEKSKILL